MVLYSAELNGQTLGIEDLPELDPALLQGITTIAGPTGQNYKLYNGVVGELKRFKMSMSIHLDQFVSRRHRIEITAELKTLISANILNAAGEFVDHLT